MPLHTSRRAVLAGGLAALTTRPGGAAIAGPDFSLPIGLPGRVLGDGFFIRHGYACENTWYNPGWWHTGEDWYLLDGETAGAGVYAVSGGEIVFTGSDYPGLVVIVRHGYALYSMYGHLDATLAVTGSRVDRGQLLGTVLDRTDGRAPGHLHFEMRNFVTTAAVNGATPRYGYGCGVYCPPGPGYWPIDAPEHPSAMGWRNPTHVIANRSYDAPLPSDEEVVVATGAAATTALWSAPSDHAEAARLSELLLSEGDRFQLLAIASGRETSKATSAEGYRLWYRIATPAGDAGWVQALRPSDGETGSDGRPSSIRFDLLPASAAD